MPAAACAPVRSRYTTCLEVFLAKNTRPMSFRSVVVLKLEWNVQFCAAISSASGSLAGGCVRLAEKVVRSRHPACPGAQEGGGGAGAGSEKARWWGAAMGGVGMLHHWTRRWWSCCNTFDTHQRVKCSTDTTAF